MRRRSLAKLRKAEFLLFNARAQYRRFDRAFPKRRFRVHVGWSSRVAIEGFGTRPGVQKKYK